MDVDETQAEKPPRPRRWPWSWRRREPDPSIATVMAQWLEYELIFNDILTRLNAQLARQAKMEKRRLERESTPDARAAPRHIPTTKQQLRSQYALSRFGSRIQNIIEQKHPLGGQLELDNEGSQDAIGTNRAGLRDGSGPNGSVEPSTA